jgi:hypothetical protein
MKKRGTRIPGLRRRGFMPKNALSQELYTWKKILNGAEVNAEHLECIEPQRQRLGEILAEVQDLDAERAVLRGRLREIQGEIDQRVLEGQSLSSRIRAGVQGQFGFNSTKLYEFGLRPDRRFANLLVPDKDPDR